MLWWVLSLKFNWHSNINNSDFHYSFIFMIEFIALLVTFRILFLRNLFSRSFVAGCVFAVILSYVCAVLVLVSQKATFSKCSIDFRDLVLALQT